MSDTPPPSAITPPTDPAQGPITSKNNNPTEGVKTVAIEQAAPGGVTVGASAPGQGVGGKAREARSDVQIVMRPQAEDGEVKVRLVTEKGDNSRRDRWDKADIVAKLLSAVVIAGVGLLINSSIQRTQIASSEANSRAQLEAAKLKAIDDKKLQEGALTAQLVQHLSSDNPTQREIAIIALRESVPRSIYDSTITVLARSDPSKDVRIRAIENLSASPAVAAAKTLTTIAQDVNRPPEERAVAEKSSQKAALSQILTGNDEIIFAAASKGGYAFEKHELGHGVFTYFVLEGLQGKADANGDSIIDANELGRYVNANVMQNTDNRQTPVFSSTSSGVVPLNKPISRNSKVKSIVIGISSYADKSMVDLAYPEADANSFAKLYARMLGSETYLLTGAAATREQIISTLQRLARSVRPEDVLVFYFAGNGVIVEGQGMLVPYSARRGSPTDFLPVEQLKTILKDVNHKIFYLDACFAEDSLAATR